MSAVSWGPKLPAASFGIAACVALPHSGQSALALVLGDMRFDGRQFGHLMPSRFTFDSGLWTAAGEPVVAVTAAGRENLDHLIDSFGRHEFAAVALVAGLAPRFSAALLSLAASLPLFASQSI